MNDEEENNPGLIEGLPIKDLWESFAGLEDAGEQEAELMKVGGYDLLEEIGRGGMGVVFRARQPGLGRMVAVKMMRSGRFAGEDELARFRGEAETLGELDHPNILAIHDVGEDEDGQPYLVMRYVEGGSLLDQVERFRRDPGLAVKVLVKVASAVEEAHRRGILHRDLKPENILLDENDEPQLTDFGLARHLEEDTGLTKSRSMLGSPHYVAPEQAMGGQGKITTAVDVYGLGAVMYHLLTGKPPFDGKTAVNVLKEVMEGFLVRPSQLNGAVDRDLETICLKCLERDAVRRYGSVREFQDDLQRWQRGEPIEARPIGGVERSWKWAKRHPVRSAVAVLMGLALVGFVVMNAYYQVNLRESRDTAVAEEEKAKEANERLRETVVRLELEQADREIAAGRQLEGIWSLIGILEKDGRNQVAADRLSHELAHRKFAVEAVPTMEHDEAVLELAFSGDGKRLATVSKDGKVRVWNADSGELLMKPVRALAGTPSLSLSGDGKVLLIGGNQGVRFYEVPGGELISDWELESGKLAAAVIDPDGEQFYVATGKVVEVRKVETGAVLWEMPQEATISPGGMVVDRAGKQLVTAHGRGMSWWDLKKQTLKGNRGVRGVRHMAFSGDGKRLLVARGQRELRMWDAMTAQALNDWYETKLVISAVALNETGDHCAVVQVAGVIDLVDSLNWEVSVEPVREAGIVGAATFRPGAEQLATASSEAVARLWDLGLPGANIEREDYFSTQTWLSNDGKLRLQRGSQYEGHASNRDGRTILPVDGIVWWLSGSPDGQEIAMVVKSRGGEYYAKVVDAASLEEKVRFPAMGGKSSVFYSPDGAFLVVIGEVSGLLVYDRKMGKVIVDEKNIPGARRLTFGPGNRWFAYGRTSGDVMKWSLENGGKREVLLRHRGGRAQAIAFHPDGRRMVTGGEDHRVCWWELGGGTAKLVREESFAGPVRWLEFSPSGGRRLVAGSRDGRVRVWDTDGGDLLWEQRGHTLALTHARFTGGGRHVLTVSMDKTARIWDAETGYAISSPMRHDVWWGAPEVMVPVSREWLDEVRRGLPGIRGGGNVNRVD